MTLPDELIRDYAALDARLRATLTRVPISQWSVRPAPGAWSIGEVLEHLCLSNEAYLAEMRGAMGGATSATMRDAKPASPNGDQSAARSAPPAWRPSLMGRLLIRSMQGRTRLSSPRVVQPGPTPRAQVDEALYDSHARLRTLIDDAHTLDWRRVRLRSPLARWVRLNLGDALHIVLRHSERHAAQIERIAAAVDSAAVG